MLWGWQCSDFIHNLVHAGMLDSDGRVTCSMRGKLNSQLEVAVTFGPSNQVFLQEIQAVLPGGRVREHAGNSKRGGANLRMDEHFQVCMLSCLHVLVQILHIFAHLASCHSRQMSTELQWQR